MRSVADEISLASGICAGCVICGQNATSTITRSMGTGTRSRAWTA